MTGNIYQWSTTAATNANVDGDINFAEGQPPSTLNNSDRQVMARVAEILGDMGGALTAGGTANVITVTANSAFTAYADGLILALRIATNNSAATTLNVNGLGAKAVEKMVAAGAAALAGGELQATGIYLLMYQSALNSATGAWLVLNPTPADQTGYATLTGIQTLTNKTLTSATLTGGTASSFTLTGSAFNGTVGATTPSTVAGTTAVFSGAISGTTVTGSGAVTGANVLSSTNIFANSSAATMNLRPNGAASTTGQVTITTGGAVTVNGTLTVTG